MELTIANGNRWFASLISFWYLSSCYYMFSSSDTQNSSLEVVVLANNTILCLLAGRPATSYSIHHGNDPTYDSLPYTDNAATGGVITLTPNLTGDTTYYIVSTINQSLTVKFRGSFTTCTTNDLISSNTLVQPQSSCRKPAGGDLLACYSGVTPGSITTYYCAEYSFIYLSGQSTRTCQSNGTWTATKPRCTCNGK